jgi:Family of unknown function (DUF5677)
VKRIEKSIMSAERRYPDQLYDDLRNWAGRGLGLMREVLPLIGPIATSKKWGPAGLEGISLLLCACARSAESAFLLIAYGQLWDAEMQSRSVFEGVLKFSYLMQSENTFARRFQEYVHDLRAVAIFKEHKKAVDLLNSVENPDDPEWKPIRDRLLSEDEIKKIEQDLPSSMRRSLEARWGFTGLIRELERSGDPLFKGIGGLAFGYSMASHYLHADILGVLLPFERDLRASERREALHRVHALRLISDLFAALWIRLQVGYRFVGANPAPIFEAVKNFEQFHASLGDVYDNWRAARRDRRAGPQARSHVLP